MNYMVPRFTFNLAANRFDTMVMDTFRSDKVSRHTRDHLIAEVRDGQWDNLLLKRLTGIDTLSAATNEKAATNLIDFHFEPIVLRHMGDAQLEAYFKAFNKTMRIESVTGLPERGPLWIDSVHHSCVFSVIYDFQSYLARDRGFRAPILLYQGQKPEPRLAHIDRLLRNTLGVPVTFIPLQGNWFSALAKAATPESAIYYFTDLPQETSRRTAPKQRAMPVLHLGAEPGIAIDIETLSGSDVFARRLGAAAHLVLEYPGLDRLRVRPFDPINPSTLCPLEDWIYWSALKAA